MISIIVPIYNASLYLRKCIESILAQTLSNFELILINDGSTDDSSSICKEYSQKDKRIIIINENNSGVSVARNRGLEIASGEWITFVDADDYFLPDALQTLYERAAQTKTDIVLANAVNLKDNKKSGPILQLSNKSSEINICDIKHFALWGYLLKADIIRKNKLRFIEGLAYSEDRIFIYQIAGYCKTIAYCDKPIYVYRINETSACSSKNGIKKAYHHIDAAFYISQIAYNYTNNYKHISQYLFKQSKHLIKLGLYLFIETPFSWNDLLQVKYKYQSRNGTSIKSVFMFYVYFISCLIIYSGRKIKSFKIKL